jgi:tRNA pseudouridine38-40 synthase
VITVQGELERALQEMTSESIRLRYASRTDAGVHARGQVAAFDVERDDIPVVGFERGLTSLTPRGIVIRRAEEVERGYKPRHASRGKHYRYTYWNDRQPSALDRRTAWWVRPPMDVSAMNEAAQLLVGAHDFEAFRAASCDAQHALRTMYRVEVRRARACRIELEVVGNAFVKNMVRIFAGTLKEVGTREKSPSDIVSILASRDRVRAGVTAPPGGLCLEEVIFDDRLPERPRD